MPCFPFVLERSEMCSLVSTAVSTSKSLLSTLIVDAISSRAVAVSGFATGASFTLLTVTETVASAVPPLPSETV